MGGAAGKRKRPTTGRAIPFADGEPPAAQEGRQEVGAWLPISPSDPEGAGASLGPVFTALLRAPGKLVAPTTSPAPSRPGRKTWTAGVSAPRTHASDCLAYGRGPQPVFSTSRGRG